MPQNTEKQYLLAIDQGTTSTRAMAFDLSGRELARAQQALQQYYPKPGWVEHDAEEILSKTFACCREVMAELSTRGLSPAALGITNQRETTVLWERSSGRALHRAIVWQDRRTAAQCDALRAQGHEEWVSQRTGLLLDPYFSASKIGWLLDQNPEWRQRAERGELAFGTIESYLIWHLSAGLHISDVTNASRTLLFNLETLQWDSDLLELFRVPAAILPEIVANTGEFGLTRAEVLGQSIAIAGMAGDQQAAALGQACIAPGMVKSTYGTGCFLLQNIGDKPARSAHRLLTTVAYQVGDQVSYAEEGSIYCAGAAMNWLRDGLGILDDTRESGALAASVESTAGVYIVPAFTGLGAPHWAAEARGLICGLSLGSGRAHIVRAMLESMAYQTYDLLQAIQQDTRVTPPVIRIDGGMAANDWMAQYLADILQTPVERPLCTETTALGAAYLAGLGCGLFADLNELSQGWRRERRFEPQLSAAKRAAALQGWRDALRRTLS